MIKPRIRLLIQSPASLGFGGGNVVVAMLNKYINKFGYDIDFLNFIDRNDDFDVLHLIGMQAGNCLNGLTAKTKGKKIVLQSLFYTDTNLFLYKLTERFMSHKFWAFSQNKFYLMQQLLNITDVILVSSKAELEQIKYIFSFDKSKAKIIHNGIETEIFDDIDDNFIEKFNLKPGYVLCVANINKKKNILNLIKAFLLTGLDTKLVLVGIYNDDPDLFYCNEVKKLINESEGKIVRVENISKGLLASAYLNAKIHVLPSFWELPGLVSLEAGLAGAGLVLGDCAPVREYFGNLATYCNPNDISDITDKITKAYNLSPTTKLSQFIKTNYSWTEIAKKLAVIYDSL
ncbi:MAG: glycosyltransferase [Patescibacteria group bacterium]|nr:glycosyltransferase [Patescibacteria group bacterium]